MVYVYCVAAPKFFTPVFTLAVLIYIQVIYIYIYICIFFTTVSSHLNINMYTCFTCDLLLIYRSLHI